MAMTLVLLLAAQDPLEQQIDEYLRQFEGEAEVQRGLAQLSSQLTALGAAAASPIARRLAVELREGMASAVAPALLSALAGRPEALAPLQAAFRDAATSVAGRIELADALAQLRDSMSWREGIRGIAADPALGWGDRLRALELLLVAGDPGALEEIDRVVRGMRSLRAPDRRRVVDLLSRAEEPETLELLVEIMEDEKLGRGTRLAAAEALLKRDDPARSDAARRIVAELRPGLSVDEPRVTITERPSRPARVSTPPQPLPLKKEEAPPGGNAKMVLGAAAAGLAVLLFVLRRRN